MLEKNAKILIFILAVFSALRALYAEPQIPQTNLEEKIDVEPREDELVVIERMISLTERQQKAQLELKELLLELKHNKKIFIKGGQSKLHAYYMLRAAKKSLRIIREYHLEHLFSSDFLDELALFSQVGTKDRPNL